MTPRTALWLGLGLVGAGILLRAVGLERLTRLPSSQVLGRKPRHQEGWSRIRVAHPVTAVYDFLRQPENAPKYLPHIDEVQTHDARHARWIMRTPGGVRVTWEGELVDDQAPKRLVWQWRERGIDAGRLTFECTAAEGGRETLVDLGLDYDRSASPLQTVFAELLPDPRAQAETALRQLKRFLETPAPEPVEPVAEREGINQGGSGSGVNM
ncbi:SRPBCC family protein [Candidatus Nitrospira bockiana]